MRTRAWIAGFALAAASWHMPLKAADSYYEAGTKVTYWDFYSTETKEDPQTSVTEPVTSVRSISDRAVAIARSGPGYLGVFNATAQSSGYFSSASADASFMQPFWTGAAAGGAVVASVPSFIDFILSGEFSHATGLNAASGGGIQVNVQLWNNDSGQRILSDVGTVSYFGTASGLVEHSSGEGLLAGFDNSPVFHIRTNSFRLSPATEYSLRVILSSSSQSPVIGINGTSSMTVDFGSTLTFGAGPVFGGELPFAVSSAGLSIVDNAWIDTRPVPEPSTSVLLLAGVALVVSVARRNAEKQIGASGRT